METEKLVKTIKDFLIKAEEFADEAAEDNLKYLDNNIDEIKSSINKLKDDI